MAKPGKVGPVSQRAVVAPRRQMAGGIKKRTNTKFDKLYENIRARIALFLARGVHSPPPIRL